MSMSRQLQCINGGTRATEQVRDYQALQLHYVFPILDFIIFELSFSFIVVYLNNICKCILMDINKLTKIR
jgi:hypothetical protein